MIHPTVGRVVLFRPAENDTRVVQSDGDEPLAAIVAFVQDGDDDCDVVNLCVIDSNGQTHPRQNVPLIQDEQSIPETGCYCEWMPYQKGQAAKTEDVTTKLAARVEALETFIRNWGESSIPATSPAPEG